MKKFLFPIFIIISLFLLISCDWNKPEEIHTPPNTLSVVSNVTSITTGRAVSIPSEGDVVEGVQLKYHNGSGDTETDTITINDPNTFYIEYLGETYLAEDGREYNYIIYIPEIIKDTFSDGHGVNGKVNSFWWYSSTYYNGKRGDWENILKMMISKKENLAYPKTENVENNWKNIDYTNNLDVNIMPRYYSYDPVNNTSYSGDDLFSKEFKLYYIDSNNTYLICYPHEIYTEYAMAGGTSNRGYDYVYEAAFYWYLSKYCNTSSQEIAQKIQNGTIEEFLSTLNSEYSNNKPKAADVPDGQRTVVLAQIPDSIKAADFEVRDVYIYNPGALILSDGTPVPDSNRPYIAIE